MSRASAMSLCGKVCDSSVRQYVLSRVEIEQPVVRAVSQLSLSSNVVLFVV